MTRILTLTSVCVLVFALMTNVVPGQTIPIIPVGYTQLNAPYGNPDTDNIEMVDGLYGTIYTDAAWTSWHRDMSLPLITFDFGSGEPIAGLSIFSLNYPGAGIAPIETFRVSFSNDGINFGTPSSFTTTAEERAGNPGLTTITRDLSGSGRYLKLSVDSNGNNAGTPYAFIDEVTFTASATMSQTLENTKIKVILDNATGRIQELWNKQTNEKYVSNMVNTYNFNTGPNSATVSYDTLDTVANVSFETITDGQKITYSCTNTDVSSNVLSIIKEYTLYDADYRVYEKLTLSNTTAGYLVVTKDVTLDSPFRNGGVGSPGYYYTNMSNSWVLTEPTTQSEKNGAMPYVPASLVTSTDRINGIIGKGLCFIRPDIGYGFGWYLYCVNGYFTDGTVPSAPYTGLYVPQSSYTSTGWSITAFTAHCYPGATDTMESAYSVFPGDQIRFAQDYQTLPGYDAAFNYPVPGWAKRNLVSNAGWYIREPYVTPNVAWEAATLAKMEGYSAGIWQYGPWAIYSMPDVPGTPDREYDCDGFYPIDLIFLADGDLPYSINQYRIGVGKKFKAGLYTTPAVIRQNYHGSDTLIAAHPRWVKRDVGGTVYSGNTTCGDPGWTREICGTDSAGTMVDYMLQEASNMVNFLNADLIYLDYGTPFAVIGDNINGSVDWYGLNQYHKDTASWFRFMGSLPQYMNDHSTTGPKAVFENNIFDRGPSIGYHEGPFPYWFKWTDGWKVAGAKLFNTKLYASKNRYNQICGTVIPDNMSGPLAYKLMFNYTIPLSIGMQFAVGSADFRNWMPFINLTAEFRDCDILDAGVTPCWWKTGGNIEAYSLALGSSTVIVPVIYHGSGSANAAITLDPSKTTLDPDKKTFVYEMSIPDLTTYAAPSFKSPLPRIVTQTLTAILPNLSSFSYNLSVPSELVKFVMISQIPGFIYSIHGLVTDNASSACPQAWLAKELDVDIQSGTVDETNQQVFLTVNIDNASGLLNQSNLVEVAAYFPGEWADTCVCQVDGTVSSPTGQVTLNGSRFFTVGIQGVGLHTVVLSKPVVLIPVRYSFLRFPNGRLDPNNTKLTDGQHGTTSTTDPAWVGWSRNGNGLPQILFDFGTKKQIASLSIVSLNSPSANVVPIETFTVSFSDDNATFSTAVSFATTSGERAGNPALTTITRNVPGSGRYLKLSAIANSSAYLFIDEVTFTGRSIPVLNGTAVLADYVGSPLTVTAVIQLFQGSGPVRTETRTLDATGGFSLDNVTAGTYDVAIKPFHWLRKVIHGVTVGGNVDLGTLVFTNGDADNDNAISALDLSIVLTAMDSTSCGGSPRDSAADLDGDGEITSTDLSIVLADMDQRGDE